MRKIKIIPVLLMMALSLTMAASCAPESPEVKEPGVTNEGIPAGIVEIGEHWRYSSQCMWGDTFVGVEYVFRDSLEGQFISSYNLRTGEKERLLEPDPTTSRIDPPSIYKNLIVWTEADISGMELGSIDWQTLNRDIFLFNTETGETRRITDDDYVQEGAVISGRWIVWLDNRHGTGEPYPYPAPLDIYAYNLDTGEEKRITTQTTAEGYGNLAISGGLIVWSDSRHADPEIQNRPGNVADYNNEIYVYNLATGEEQRITDYPGNDHYPAVNGDRIAWLRQLDLRRAEIVVYDLETGTVTPVSSSGYAAYTPSVYEDRVVWSDAGISEGNTSGDVILNGVSGAAEIYMYDLTFGEESLLVPSEIEGEYEDVTFRQVLLNPVIHENNVVYTNARQIGSIVYAMRLDE